jgi:hypothetical protein
VSNGLALKRKCGSVGGRCRSEEKSKSGTFPPRLEIPQERRDFHFFHRPGGDGQVLKQRQEPLGPAMRAHLISTTRQVPFSAMAVLVG